MSQDANEYRAESLLGLRGRSRDGRSNEQPGAQPCTQGCSYLTAGTAASTGAVSMVTSERTFIEITLKVSTELLSNPHHYRLF